MHQLRAGQAAVAADGDVRLALCQALRADGATDPVGRLRGQGIADHAADVVGAEDAGGKFRWGLYVLHVAIHEGLLQSQEILVFVENVDIEDIGGLEQRVRQLRRLGHRCGGSDRGTAGLMS